MMEANVTLAYEWLNRNSRRSFPLKENGNPTMLGLPLRKDILVDAFVVIRGEPSSVFLRALTFTKKTVTAVIADSISGASCGFATAILGRDPVNASVKLISPNGNASGHLIFGKILKEKTFNKLIGSFSFSPEETELETRCSLSTGKPIISEVSAKYQNHIIRGTVHISLSDEVEAVISETVVAGQREYVVTLNLVNPENFLPDCYPKYTADSCNCGRTPIVTVNGVSRDPITKGIEIVFGGGLSGTVNADTLRNLVKLLVTQTKGQICLVTPVMPDDYGRLGPNYDDDCPPETDYGSNKGPSCQNPPTEIQCDQPQ